MKSFKYSLTAFLFIAFIANLPIIGKQLLHDIDQDHFRYSNLNASFTRVESFGFKDGYISKWGTRRFVEENNPAPENRTIYRLYRINPLCFWRWSYYLFTSRDYPFNDWKEIEKNRVPYVTGNMWQDF